MHYAKEKKNLKDIVYDRVHFTNENDKVNLNILPPLQIEQLIKNYPPSEIETNDLSVYHYTYNEGQCNMSYIVYTQCILKLRFSGHPQNGSIKNHILAYHLAQKVKALE